MTDSFIHERSLEDVVEAYIFSCKKNQCVSISHAVRAIQTFSKSSMTYKELADLVAAAAVNRNIPVHFDRDIVDP